MSYNLDIIFNRKTTCLIIEVIETALVSAFKSPAGQRARHNTEPTQTSALPAPQAQTYVHCHMFFPRPTADLKAGL